jgi:hypothetical protein
MAAAISEETETIEEVEEKEELGSLEDIEDIEDIEGLDDLEDLNLEELKQIHPLLRRILKLIPTELLNNFLGSQNKDIDSSETENRETAEKQKIDIDVDELLPDSINVHPSFTLVDYQDLDDIPDAVIKEIEIEEKFINRKTKVMEFEVNLPERRIEELRELEEVPEDISDSMIEDNKDDLEFLYNFKEVLGWYEKQLQENNWEILKGNKKEGLNIMFQHERDGYLIIPNLENLIYTPKI